MRTFLGAIICTGALALAGCGNRHGPNEDWASKDHLTGKLARQVSEENAVNVAEGESGYFVEYNRSYLAPADGALARAYVTRGVALSRETCEEHLFILASRANDVAFGREQAGLAIVLATGVLGLAGAGIDAFTGLALGGAFANSSADLYQNHYLLGPDADAVVILVRDSLAQAEIKIATDSPESFDQAYRLLNDYSYICTNYEIRRIVRSAIERAKPKAKDVVDAETKQHNEKALIEGRSNLAAVLNVDGALSANQTVGLYWRYIVGATDGTDLLKKCVAQRIDALLGSAVASAATNNRDKIVGVFTGLPAPVRTSLKTSVDVQSDAIKKAVEMTPAPTCAPPQAILSNKTPFSALSINEYAPVSVEITYPVVELQTPKGIVGGFRIIVE